MTCPKAVRTGPVRLLTYFLLITFLSCRRVNPKKSISTDSQQMFARGGERKKLGLDCRLIIAADLGHINSSFFFSDHYGRYYHGDGMIVTMKFLALQEPFLG